MINVLNLATNGFIDDMTPLSIALGGLLTIPTPDDVVVIVPPLGGGAGGGGEYYPPYQIPIKDRIEDINRTICKDDDEVLEILIHMVTHGVLN